MNPIIEFLTGMGSMTDQVIAMDYLVTVKSGIRNGAMALTECVTPEIRAVLTRQLEESLDLHEKLTAYMLDEGLYQPWSLGEQFQLDVKNANTALDAPTL